MTQDITTAPLVVGMVNVFCPSCSEPIPTDVRIQSVETKNGSYLIIKFQDETPTHKCVGRRA